MEKIVDAKKFFMDDVKLEKRLEELAEMKNFTGPAPLHVTFVRAIVRIGRFHFWLRPVEMPRCDQCQSVNWYSEDYRYTPKSHHKYEYISLPVATCLSCGKKVALRVCELNAA